MLLLLLIYRLLHQNRDKSKFKNFISEKFKKKNIFQPAFHLIMCLMKAPKNFEKIAIMKLWHTT